VTGYPLAAVRATGAERPSQVALCCPIHRSGLKKNSAGRLECDSGCGYPVIDGIPFLLPRNIAHTNPAIARQSFVLADKILSSQDSGAGPADASRVDAVVQDLVAATNSNLYQPLVGQLRDYPIPLFPMVPVRPGQRLLDIGCGWGRWCVAASRAGFLPVGVDPSLESVLAAKRVAARLGAEACFAVADSRYLPFPPATFDAAFSYSVLQHFADEDVCATLRALAGVMKPGSSTKLHMLNRYGLRSLQVQLQRSFRPATGFETRYWSPRELRTQFSALLGPSELELDGFFVQARYEDRHLFRPHHRVIVEISHALALMTKGLPWMKNVADNLFVVSRPV
jgi:2-polyprenyl-3-methyl-5-hydroxy-6-metoxy-1,4-benzoquinol methylase/uncharacterized protein YbaR (Trm112 family)